MVRELNSEEIKIIDEIIDKFGKLTTDEIINVIHEEDAYKCTKSNCIIKYSFANQLSI
ncbi:MAG: DUF4065 domain-containing protein [Firmicutes bacterium]|nr:DUF4065 domain-containing protein [Bacillota bacterium]